MLESNMWEMEQRRFSLADNERLPPPSRGMIPSTSEDLHAWSIYRQNLNSDFTDSALGSSEKSPLPYGNFQLRESTVQSILNHPRYGPKSPLGANMYTYLKFGLPRVFPPNGKKDTSSGYNSSEEGTRPRRSSYVRPRSEADFVNLQYYHQMGGSRGKSLSQANLLSPETLLRQVEASHRRSLHDLRHTDYMLHHHPPPHQLKMLRRGSVGANTLSPPLPPEPFSFSMLHPQEYRGLYPHLQVRNLNVRGPRGEPLVNNMSLEVKAGEILSIMSTSNDVNRSILDVISGYKSYSGHISLNGQVVGSAQLKKVVSYVRSETTLPPDLPVYNCLRFYAKLKRPSRSRGKIPMSEQVRIVTEELGLSPVLTTKVAELTRSEYARLLVAIQLLSDPQLICIDHITHCMDIFDTFFLVEFLRQWASGATGGVIGRIVIISLQPPTYEILTMISRLVILSSGETMYHGPARHLTQYFTSADYPCPAFKNPADYYLDLVTLDDLSAEAMLESSQRVDQLAAIYRRRQQPLSEPQPYNLPEEFLTPNPFTQTISLLKWYLFYSQPSSFLKWLSRVLLAVFMSMIVGVVFWDIPNSDPFLMREDRMGYHFTVGCVASFPLVLLLGLSKARDPKLKAAKSDIQQGLYSSFLYIIVTMVCSWIPSVLIWTAYLVPSYCMTGMYDPSSNSTLAINLGYMLVCLLILETVASVVGDVCDGGLLSVILYTLVHWAFSVSTGYPVHSDDLPLLNFKYSPLATLYKQLLKTDYSNATLTALNSQLVCRNRQVQRQDIIVHQSCPVPNGGEALSFHGLRVHGIDPFYPPVVTLASASLLVVVVFLMTTIVKRRST